MINYTPLQVVWPSLSGTTRTDKLAAVNAMLADGPPRPVPVKELSAYFRRIGVWLQIVAAAKAGTSVGAMAAVDLNNDLRIDVVDMALPIVGEMLAEMVSKSVITQEHVNGAMALAGTKILWTVANNLPNELSVNDLAAAGIQ